MKPGKSGKKKGKLKTSKSKDSSFSSQVEDVLVHTGLPPQVEGQLRCFCRVSVSQISWTIPNSPGVTHVRVKWWGESGDGAIFRPVDPKHPGKVVPKTTARYPVRSGPKQFAAYLNDMGSLLIEVLSGKEKIAVGRAEVPQISLLSTAYPINGSFPVFSSSEEKIAELQISLIVESLMASYDSMGSIPTTDVSVNTVSNTQGLRSALPKQLQPSPYPISVSNSAEDPFASPLTNKSGSRQGNDSVTAVPELPGYEGDLNKGRRQGQNGDTVFITTGGDVIRTNPSATGYTQSQSYRRRTTVVDGTHPGSDLLSTLLDRGTRLREAMIVSSLNSETDPPTSDLPNPKPPLQLPMETGKRHSKRFVEVTPGLVENVPSPVKSQIPGECDLSDLEGRTVDLILGHTITNKEYQYLKSFDGSPQSSISEDLDLGSELEDPLHDDTIIQQLFYKNPESDKSSMSGVSGDEGTVLSRTNRSLASVEDPGNIRPPSRRSSYSSGAEFTGSENGVNNNTPNKRKTRPKLKKKIKGVKKGKRSRSRSRTRSVSDLSDSDQLSTPRSENSRVSFDMTPSDQDEPIVDKPPKSSVDGLSVERLTLLGRVHVARVTIESLRLTGQDLNQSVSSKKGRTIKKKRPPMPSPKAKKPSTYFVEYQFPVVATSRDKHAPNAMATEVMRVASKNVKDSSVQFNHRSVFPIYFDGSAIEKWWKSALVFKVFSRTPGQKTPIQVGSCGVSLKSILKSDGLCLTKNLEVRDGNKGKKNTSIVDSGFGDLKVAVELASDSKDFSTALAKTKLAEMQGKVKIMPINPDPPPPSLPPMGLEATRKYKKMAPRKESLPITQYEPARSDLPTVQNTDTVVIRNFLSRAPSPPAKQTVFSNQQQIRPQVNSIEPPTLYTMLLIPEGRNVTNQGARPAHNTSKHPTKMIQPSTTITGVDGRNLMTRNTYLSCRMFWCDDVVTSNVTWGTSEPQYGFNQVAPVLVSLSLLERMRNNFMIVEVWDKKTSAEHDQLVGIVKLSLHQFYMSFREQKIANSLLRSQFPVISVDGYLPIMDPFSGSQFGQLKILLAMGSSDQISYLQRLKVDPSLSVPDPQRPLHYLERENLIEQSKHGGLSGPEALVDHQFEVVVEGIRNLQLFEDMIWGEADCFVQYYFPCHTDTNPPGGHKSHHGVVSLKSFRTATTLCLPDPTFHDVTRHRLLLSPGTPVQREILTACSGSGHGSGGLPFEVWCRYYHPNVRDQVVAKGTLPLAKVCAMVTMQKKGENTVQTFSLPLTSVLSIPNGLNPEKQAKVKDCGLMDVTVTYKTQLSTNQPLSSSKHDSGPQVCISVGVIRASGLKAAAEALAHLDSGMQYPAEVGVNAYVKIIFSFLSKEDERLTRTVARTFAPEFSHHMDFPCPLLWTEADSDALSLAEIIESGELTLELWHQVPGLSSGIQEPDLNFGADDIRVRRLVTKMKDVLLGSTTIQLRALLTHRTGIMGWFPVNQSANEWQSGKEVTEPDQIPIGQGLSRVVGGLELSVKFAHHDDRERVINTGRGVGWSPLDLDVEEEEAWHSEDEIGRSYEVTVSVHETTFPLQNAMIIGQDKIDHQARCYVRYKLYDRASVVSKSRGLEHSEFGFLKAKIKHKQHVQLSASSPLKWYLREERLEMQVWVSYGHHGEEQRPRHRDKLIGSAFISMETLVDPRRKQHKISGLYPLFKPGTASLGGGYLRAHFSLKPYIGPVEQVSLIEEGSDVIVEDLDYDPNDSFHQHTAHRACNSEKVKGEEELITPSFTAHISVERAMHLPWVTERHGSPSNPPNPYVSFQTSELSRPVSTSVVVSSEAPVWDYQVETTLTTQLLFQENKNLVFKVWHKPDTASREPDKSSDRVLGFVSVDLVPLTTGLQQLCGWYNIMDFNGQCQGQIKVSVTPLESLAPYRGGLPTSCQTEHLTPTNQSSVFYPPVVSQLSVFDQLPRSDHTLGPIPWKSDPSQSHFQEHYRNVKYHHEMLQKQGETISIAGDNQGRQSESIHWNPNFPMIRDQHDSSKSFLFSALRKQMNDLDEINNKFKARLAIKEESNQQTVSPYHGHESILLSSRSEQQPLSSRSGQFVLNSTIGTSSSVGKDSARDSGNITGTHHEISNDMIGSHSIAPSVIPEDHGQTTVDYEGPSEQARQPVFGIMSGATNTLSSELEVSEDFLNNHVPPGIQALLAAARNLTSEPGVDPVQISGHVNNGASETSLYPTQHNIHQPSGQDYVGQQNNNHGSVSCVEEHDVEVDHSSDEDDQQVNYFQRYQNFLEEGSDQTDNDNEDDDVDIVTPRALNDVSGKGFRAVDNFLSVPDPIDEPPKLTTLPDRAHDLSSVTDTDSWLAEPSFNPIENEPEYDNDGADGHENIDHGTDETTYDNHREGEAKYGNHRVEDLSHCATNQKEDQAPCSGYQGLQEAFQTQLEGHVVEDQHQVHQTVSGGSQDFDKDSLQSDLDGEHKEYCPPQNTIHPDGPVDTEQPYSNQTVSNGGGFYFKSVSRLETIESVEIETLAFSAGQSTNDDQSNKSSRSNSCSSQNPSQFHTKQAPSEESDGDKHSSNSHSSAPRSRSGSEHDPKETGEIDCDNQLFTQKSSRSREVTLQKSKLPNFFPSAEQMAKSMKALESIAGTKDQPEDDKRKLEKASAAQEVVRKLHQGSSASKFQHALKSKPLPTADQTKRIAKIFSAKFT